MINEVKRRLSDLEKNGYPLKRAMYIEKNPAREKDLTKKYETLRKIWLICFAIIILGAIENFSNDPVRISIMLCIWWISVAYAIGVMGIQISENAFIRKNGVKIQARIIAVTPDERKKNIVWYAKDQWDVVSDRNNLQAIRSFRENIIGCLIMILYRNLH